MVAVGRGVSGVTVGDAVAAMADSNGDGGWAATGGRTRRRVAAIDGVKTVLKIVPGIDGKAHQTAALQIVRHHEFGHRAPAETRKQQRMLRAKVGQPPALHRHDPEIMIRG